MNSDFWGEIPTTRRRRRSMETTAAETKQKERRRKMRASSRSNNITTVFCSTLAALKTPLNPYSKTLLLNNSLKLLHLIHPNSTSSSLESLLNAVFTVLPPLLLSGCDDVVCTAAKMVGMTSLLSIQLHHRIASDIHILKSLCVTVLRAQNMDAKKAVCNAVLDLSLTSLASQNLLHLSALNFLLLGFLQVQELVASPLSIIVMENAGNKFLAVEHHQDEVPLLFLNAAATLTNFCNTEQLKNIPSRLKEAVIPFLREIWSKIHEQLLASRSPDFSQAKHCYMSNLTIHSLAESIFRLSMTMDAPGLTYSISSEAVIRHIFGPWSSSFTDFMLKHWESSPFLIKNQQRDLDASQSFFSSFMQSLTCEETLPKFLSSILGGMVSCPPVGSNEIDSLSFLNDLREGLGSPMIYQQDIRVVRTNLLSKSEEHYFQDSSSNGNQAPRCLSAGDISKCETAYREGYTIALRGMGFRFSSVAAITREIASFFGQPSIGANLYVTPPNSQGLSCHYDDHCVFICQLYGDKQWTIFPQPVVKLPRLYEYPEIPQDILVERRQILLRQGDVLYLPRGFAHEACTITDVEASRKSSIHLTLALEVEPPFEWEGLAHVALHHWSQKRGSDIFSHGNSAMQAISVTFLHVAIKLISNTEPILRKACLVAASSLPTVTQDWLDKDQRATFNQVIAKINELSCFKDSLEFLQMAIQKDDDPFHWLRWLEHLNEKEVPNQDIWVLSLDEICSSLSFIHEHKDNAEAEFAHVKSNFCNEVLFDDAKESFKTLHAMYKDARMQYMNGMLSLHR